MSIEAMKQARGVISSINQGKQHALTVNDETVFWQREEWVRWALDEVLPSINQAIEQAEQAQPVALDAKWQPCVKLPVTVHVRTQRLGETHVSTREGITPVKPDDLIMRGVSGEEYPIGREIFEKTYQLGEAPPPRQPLTDEQIGKAWAVATGEHNASAVVKRRVTRAIEAAHKIGV